MRKLKLEELNRPDLQTFRNIEKIPLVIILDNVRSAMNVGSVFRTADAFACEKIILGGITATPPNREITKTAIGATESVIWEYASEIADYIAILKADGYKIFGIEQTEQSVMLDQQLPKHDKAVLIFGNEVDGVSDSVMELLDGCIEIPQFGTKHSLNVAVCAGIVMWEFSKYHRSIR
jgi:23S rRNA (guanosine2251-2'-O)-methyltransferase